MISTANYLNQAGNINFSTLPMDMQEAHKLAEKALSRDGFMYNKSSGIKEAVDLYIETLNDFLAEQHRQEEPELPVKVAKPKAAKVLKIKAEKPVKVPKVKAEKPQKPDIPRPPKPIKQAKVPSPKLDIIVPYEAENPGIAIEIAFIKRYVKLHEKRVEPKTITNFLAAIERAVLERKIRKTSSLAQKIEHIRSELKKLHNQHNRTFTFQLDNSDSELPVLAKTHVFDNTVPLIKRFLTIFANTKKHTTSQLKVSADLLLRSIEKAIKTQAVSDRNLYFSEVEKIQQNLANFIDNDEELHVSQSQLNGLSNMAGLSGFSGPSGLAGNSTATKMNSTELARMKFDVLPLRDAWADCLGTVTLPFSMMVFGGPGSGKSSFCILFAHFLAAELNKKILYVAAEEAIGATLKEKFTRLDAFHENIVITTKIDECCSGYDFVFIDSVNELQLSPEKVSELIRKAKSKNISLILIYRGTKGGSFRGEETNENLVDISLKVEQGVVTPRKNRFGGKGEMRVY